MVAAKLIFNLQTIDQEIHCLNKTLDGIQFKLNDKTKSLELEKGLEAANSEMQEETLERKRNEVELIGFVEKIGETDAKLYGGSVTSPRELTNFQEEKASLEKQKVVAEENLFTVLIKVDEIQEKIHSIDGDIKQLADQFELELPKLTSDLDLITSQINKLQNDREKLLPFIPAASVSTYESLRNAKNGYAVAKVKRGLCEGCRIILPNSEYIRAKSSPSLTYCSNCRRILFAE